MKYLKTVYVHRYSESDDAWHKKELSGVLVSGTQNSYSLSDTLNRDAHITLRVMGNADADVIPQDVISFKESDGAAPPDNDIAVVVSITKNSCGSKRVRHTKIICR